LVIELDFVKLFEGENMVDLPNVDDLVIVEERVNLDDIEISLEAVNTVCEKRRVLENPVVPENGTDFVNLKLLLTVPERLNVAELVK
jgi:hypothetical protein